MEQMAARSKLWIVVVITISSCNVSPEDPNAGAGTFLMSRWPASIRHQL